jgi:hypothetical protein
VAKKPTYEELEQRVREPEQEVLKKREWGKAAKDEN